MLTRFYNWITSRKVIIFLLWIWISNLALLFGAEFDVQLERGRELAAGTNAEIIVKLPLKSSKAIRKREDRRDKDILKARKIRQSA